MARALREIIIFALGVLITLDALINEHDVVPKLIIGMIMVGVLPIDTYVAFRQKQSIDPVGKCEVERKTEAPE